MPDIHHQWGSDLVIGATGDLLSVAGSEATRQRVIRRLLSNQTDLLFQPDYGAGLPARIGTLLDTGSLDAAVRAQMGAERGVAQDPMPEVSTAPFAHGATVVIRYRDRGTGEGVSVGFDVAE